jgi:ABC-2 type transport system permease protein
MLTLWKLTWLEIKIFAREPLGLFGTVGVPVLVFVVLGRTLGRNFPRASSRSLAFAKVDLPILGTLLIVLSAVLSMIAIIAIYREGGILKRLRATPLRPWTILTAQVLVKLSFTTVTFLLMIAAGKRFYPVDLQVPIWSFSAALLLSTLSILSVGFLVASLVPTARFAQPVGSVIFYPMLAISGLFVPLAALPPLLRGLARLLPFTYAVSLLRGLLIGDSLSAHWHDIGALVITFCLFTIASARLFRWE